MNEINAGLERRWENKKAGWRESVGAERSRGRKWVSVEVEGGRGRGRD